MDVVIDGVRYTPGSRIGVGITTHNRPEVFAKTLAEMRKHLPPGAKLVVVDDASSQPVAEADYRFEENAGIARAKNKCLELLDDCEHIFLFDDDCYPKASGWERPYIQSPEPHLMYQFIGVVQNGKVTQATSKVIASDGLHVAYDKPRGSMLYAHRSCLEKAGGMDGYFGRWGHEHVDWSNRIHAFGLTTWRYADVVNSESLIHCADEFGEAPRSVPTNVRVELNEANREHLDAQANQAIRYEYRALRDVVATPLLVSQPDVSKGGKCWSKDTSVLDALRKSVAGHEFVVLHDALDNPEADGAQFVQMPSYGLSPYFQRWVSAYQWLRDTPDVGRVWFVDGSDVEMRRPPWDGMKPGRLYVGDEPSTLNKEWMLKHHPAPWLQEFMTAKGDLPLLNAGLLGGERSLVLAFLAELVRVVWDTKAEHGKLDSLGLGDMALFNWVAYERFGDVVTHGPQVNTTFKAYEKNDWSWWAHK